MMSIKNVVNSIVSTGLIVSSTAMAVDSKGVWSISIENDLFGSGQDKHYTHGTEASYVSDTYHPKWLLNIARLAPFYSPQKEVRYGVSLGQAIFTPDDITRTELIENDRPYAGWLYSTFSLMNDFRTLSEEGERRNYNDVLELTLGIVGPSSQADDAQKWVHKNVDADDPNGWDNQLHDELGVNIAYMRQWQYTLLPKYIDVTTRAGGMLGNVFTHVETGLLMRFGNRLGQDFGPPLMRPSNIGSKYFKPRGDFSWYFFTGLNGRYVGRNIFLDGNTWQDSHSVDKKHWVGDIQAGFVVNVDRLQFSFTHIFRSKEFEKQKNNDEFGALSLSYRF
jgi:hypothetical protein